MSKYSELERAKYAAFLYLGRRSLTYKQMVDKLQKKEYSEETIKEVMEYLEELNYINDSEYTRRYVADAVNLKKHGKHRIKQDLRLKGISPHIVDEIFEELEPDTNEVLRNLVEIKSKNMDINIPKEKNRLINFLIRRGFSYDDIFHVLNEFTNDEW